MAKVTCHKCGGSGRVRCEGNCMHYGTSNHPDNCPACGGENEVRCPECNGKGRVEE